MPKRKKHNEFLSNPANYHEAIIRGMEWAKREQDKRREELRRKIEESKK